MLIINKFNTFSVSIQENSNKVLSSTQENLSALTPNTLIKIGESDLLYPVKSSKNVYFNKVFEVVNSRQIKINENTEIFLQKEDVVRITYDEYELDYLFDIENRGKFYVAGDVINVKGGELSIDIKDGMGQPTKFLVEEIGEGGSIKKLSIKNKGKYIVKPNEKSEVWNNRGESCVLCLKYKLSENKTPEEKTIKNIEFKDGYTLLTLDYSLPPGVKNGKLSCEKSEITLETVYLGKTQHGASYKIIKDFTEHFKLPFTTKNNPDFHLVWNDAISKIDKALWELKNKT